MQQLLTNLKPEDMIQSRDAIRFARPSTARPSVNGGSVASMPKGSRGILCPYVECNPFDTHSLPYYFLLYFHRLTGTTYAEIGEALPIIRRNLEQIATTSLGWILTHIMTGIHLSMTSGARIYIIKEGTEYLGFALLGSYFALSIDGDLYVPRSNPKFIERVNALRSSEGSLTLLAEEISGWDMLSSKDQAMKDQEVVRPQDIDTSAKILAAVMKRIAPTKDGKPNLEVFYRHYGRIRFNTKFRSLTTFTMKETLMAMCDPTGELATKILANSTIFIPETYSNFSTKESQLLLTFGPETFSPNTGRGFPISVGKKCVYKEEVYQRDPSRGGRQVKTIKETAGISPENRLDKIMFSRKEVDKAWADWRKFKSDGILTFNPAERAQGSSTHVLLSKMAIEMQLVLAEYAKDASEPAKKRKRDDGVAEESPEDLAAKKAKYLSFLDGI